MTFPPFLSPSTISLLMMVIFNFGCDINKNTSSKVGRCEVISYSGGGWAEHDCYYYTYQNGVLSAIKYDDGCNGIDINCTAYYYYNERGLLSEAHSDSGCDNVDQTVITHEYDDEGRLIRSQWLGGGEVCFRYTLDRNSIIRNKDIGCWGDDQHQESFYYDNNGNQTQYSFWDGVGSNNYFDYYMDYDERNNLIQNEYCYLLEPDGDLFGEWRCESTSFEYDNQDRVVTSRRGGFSDGLPRYCATYAYDAAGRMIREEHDVNCDGRFDPVTDPWYLYEYDASSVLRRRFMNYEWYSDSREFILHKENKGPCEKPQQIRTELEIAREFPILENEY